MEFTCFYFYRKQSQWDQFDYTKKTEFRSMNCLKCSLSVSIAGVKTIQKMTYLCPGKPWQSLFFVYKDFIAELISSSSIYLNSNIEKLKEKKFFMYIHIIDNTMYTRTYIIQIDIPNSKLQCKLLEKETAM